MFDFVPYDLLFGGLLSPSRRDLVADVNPAKAPAPQAAHADVPVVSALNVPAAQLVHATDVVGAAALP